MVEQARISNYGQGITGVLLYAEGRYLQVLEGDMQAVRDLYYHRIATDPRHEHLVVLSEGPSAVQVFTDWCMSFRAGPTRISLPGYLSPNAAYLRVTNLPRARPELRRLLLDFAAGYDDSPLAESMVGSRR